jgi:hypothetical protein
MHDIHSFVHSITKETRFLSQKDSMIILAVD